MRLGYLFFLGLVFLPVEVSANVVISEIMYDLDGADSGKEWVEIYNNGNESVDLNGWKFFENGTNHGVATTSKSSGFVMPANSYAIIADNFDKFLIDWPDFSGVVFDSVFSLSNDGENVILRDSELKDADGVDYVSVWGANGDGNSLQKMNGEWLPASPTPGRQNTVQENSEPVQSIDVGVSVSDSYVSPQDLPAIKACAGKDRTMIAGATADFNGQAFGLEDKPLERARYLWNFGDGTIKEGQDINHFYKYPGEYKVILEISSGGYSVSDDLIVKVVPNEIFISEIKTGTNSFIELENPSGQEINISGWAFRSDNQIFTFSKNSFIRPHGYLVISASASGIIFYQGNGRVELLYPGGFLADSFDYNGVVSSGQSFSRDRNGSAITRETPGAKNDKAVELTSKTSEVAGGKSVVQETNNGDTGNSEICADESASACEVKLDGESLSQTASVVGVSENNSSRNNNKVYYFLGTFVLIIFSGAGVYFIRRQS